MYYLCTQMIAEAPCKDFVLRLPLRDAIRRDGRVVDYSSLENCRTERYRGFESLSLRKQGCKSATYAIRTLYYTQKSKPPTNEWIFVVIHEFERHG